MSPLCQFLEKIFEKNENYIDDDYISNLYTHFFNIKEKGENQPSPLIVSMWVQPFGINILYEIDLTCERVWNMFGKINIKADL